MKKYALNFVFINSSIICVVVETNLNEGRFRKNLIRQMKKDITFITDVNGATYMIQRDRLNYFMFSELPEETEEMEEAADGLRDSEVEEEAAAHPEA